MIASDWRQTGSLTAAEQAVTISRPGMGCCAVQIGGTFVGTVTYEVGNDLGGTFVAIKGCLIGTGAKATTDTTANSRVFPTAGWKYFRARCSAYTSGTITVNINASYAACPENAQYT
jgi:hypothetical protein